MRLYSTAQYKYRWRCQTVFDKRYTIFNRQQKSYSQIWVWEVFLSSVLCVKWCFAAKHCGLSTRKGLKCPTKSNTDLKRGRNQLLHLNTLSKAGRKTRQRLINYARRDLIIVLCDWAHNCLKENVSLASGQNRYLARDMNELRSLLRTDQPVAEKRKILQRDGLLGALLKIAILFLSSLIGQC